MYKREAHVQSGQKPPLAHWGDVCFVPRHSSFPTYTEEARTEAEPTTAYGRLAADVPNGSH